MRLPAPWRRRRTEEEPAPAPAPSGSHDDRLKSIRPMHFEPDDEGHTREDKERERKDREADRQPPFFG
jgi:hypothetical protein